MDRSAIIKYIEREKIVAVIRADSIAGATRIASACAKGGVKVLEITFTVPDAEKVIQSMSKEMQSDLLIGAGTVLDEVTARIAILAGAKFIVGPNFSVGVAKVCNIYQVPYMPGCGTITEMLCALEHGCEIIKLFPGSAYGPSYIKAINAALPQLKIMPTGGVDLTNVSDWIRNGAVVIGVGSKMTDPAKLGDYKKVTELARAFKKAG